MEITLTIAKKLIGAADAGDINLDHGLIEAGEPYKCYEEIEALGEDYFYLRTRLCPDTYGLETDWTNNPCIIGPSGGNGDRTIVYVSNKLLEGICQ